MLHTGDGVIKVKHEAVAKTLHVRVNRSKINFYGKPLFGWMLFQIHVWRYITNIESCRDFYKPLSAIYSDYEVWRQTVVLKLKPGWKLVQANTILSENGEVELRAYEESNKNII